MADLSQVSNTLFLGPFAIGAFFQAMLQGVIFGQTYEFLTKKKQENALVLATVAYLSCVSIAQTGIALNDIWSRLVVSYGNYGFTLSYHPVDLIITVLIASMTAPVQGYYIWRCFKITMDNYFVLAGLASLLASSWATAVVVTYNAYQVPQVAFPPTSPCFDALCGPFGKNVPIPTVTPGTAAATISSLIRRGLGKRNDTTVFPLSAPYVYWLVSTTLLDIIITGILLRYLYHMRQKTKNSPFKTLEGTVQKLVRVAWQTAAPPCLFAIITMVVYLALANTKYSTLDIFLEQFIGKLYIISLLLTLNARIALGEDQPSHQTYEMTSGPTHNRARENTTVRVDVQTTVGTLEFRRPDAVGVNLDPELGSRKQSFDSDGLEHNDLKAHSR